MKAKAYIFTACFCLFLSWGYSQENEELLKLNTEVVKLYQEGRYQEGIALAEKAYKKSLSLLGEKHLATLSSMNNLAGFYEKQGKYSEAEPLYEKTLQLTGEILGEKNLNTLISMNNLAALYRLQGRYSKAEPLYIKALPLMREVLGENHLETLILMNNLAELYNLQGEYSKAKSLLIKTLQRKKEALGARHPDTLLAMSGLGNLYKFHGEYSKAKPLLVNVLQLREKVLGKNHPDTLISMGDLAGFYESQGEYSEAERLFLKTLQRKKEVLGERHPDTLRSMMDLGGLYESQGEYKKAEPLYTKALQLRVKILGKKNPSSFVSMNNLAGLYKSQGKYAESETLYIKVLELMKEVLEDKHPNVLASMNNLAGLYILQRKYSKAETLYIKVLESMKEVLGEKHPSTLSSMNNLAGLYRVQKKYGKAEALYAKTLQLTKEVWGEKHPNTLASMNHLIRLYRSKGEYDRALPLLEEHLAKKYLLLKREFRGNSEKTRLSMLEKFDVTSDKNDLFSILEEYPKEDYDRLALYFSANYKGILLQISRELKQVFHDVSDQNLLKELLEKRSAYSSLSLGYEKQKKNRVLAEKLEKEIDELEKKLIWKSNNFKDLISDVKAEDVQKALSEDELLVDFVVYKSLIVDKNKYKLAAVVVNKRDIKLVSLRDFEGLTSLIKNYRNKIQKKEEEGKKEEGKELSQKIYERIFSPLIKHLQGKKKLYIVPDGVLHLLPFRSLIDENGQYLVESKNIVLLSSGRDLVIKNREKSNQSAAIFAYPNYGEGEGKEILEDKTMRFSSLKGTLGEAQVISLTLNIPTKVYTQDEATEKNISQMDSPQILHIATHGYFLDLSEEKIAENEEGRSFSAGKEMSNRPILREKLTNPLVYSGVALAGANNRGEDGILTALEVLGLNLLGTDLVVLSACETGVGEVRQGEGVYSLQRAFREAGAKSVLGTLWKVDDQATQIFMKKFYQRYMHGDSPQKAVIDTQLEFLKSKRYSHPFYWSSFVMIGGEADDLEQENIVVVEKQDRSSIVSFVLLSAIILIIAFLILAHKKKEKRLLEERIAKRRKRQERV